MTTTTRPPGRTLAVLATAQFLVVLNTSIVNVALPSIGVDLGLSPTGLSWIVNSYGLAFGALLLLGGRAADRFGRRKVFLAGLTLFGIASLAAALAPTAWLLITARAVQGVGAAALAPAALSLVTTIYPPGAGRARALGLWGVVSGAGGAAGVLLGGVLTDALGWSSIFFISVPVAAAVGYLAAWLVDRDQGQGGRIDTAGAFTVTVGLGIGVYGLTAAARSGWTSPTVLASLGTAILLLAGFIVLQHRGRDPLLPLRIFTTGSVGTANVAMALLGAVWVGMFFFLPLYQQKVLGDSALVAGLSQLPLALTNMLFAALAPRIATRIGSRTTLVGGLVLLAGGLFWLSRISPDGSFLSELLAPTLLVGAGLGIAFVQLTTAAMTGISPRDAGLAGGLVNTTRQVGGALGLAVLSTIAAGRTGTETSPAALTAGYRLAFLAGSGLIALAIVLVLLARRGRATAPTTREEIDHV